MRYKRHKFTELEKELLDFVHLNRSLRMPVTDAVISTKAESLNPKYRLSSTEFKASKGWLNRICMTTGIG